MGTNNSYPCLYIHADAIGHNINHVVGICNQHGIHLSGVVKGFNALQEVVDQFVQGGCKHIASSRIEQLIELKRNELKIPTMLIRLPRLCELEDLVDYVDISLNSEWCTLSALEEVCQRKQIKHEVILMLDVGDLREGFYSSVEIVAVAARMEREFRYVRLIGIGTNVGCYGSVKPTETNMQMLCDCAVAVEEAIKRPLKIISGGSTTSLSLVLEGKMPPKINHLRVGEAVLNARDLTDLWDLDLKGFRQDTFILEAQIVEIKDKPSHPVGELFIDAFGNRPVYADRGVRRRALLAVGKQDFGDHTKLIPLQPGVELMGSSSDHCIADIEDCDLDLAVGDTLKFSMFYQPMLFLTTSPYVVKKVVYDGQQF